MIRSGKTPRHNDSSANNNVDKISDLPDSLLIDILSLLPPYDIKQTRIVSKRWKNLFAFLPGIRFLMKSYSSLEQVKNFHIFVDQTLAIRGNMPIENLLLKGGSGNKCDYDCFCDILCTLVRFKAGVRELKLRFPQLSGDRNNKVLKYRNNNKVLKSCGDLFKTWDSLVALTLDGEFVLDVPNDNLIFPCLKKLSLLSDNYLSCESVANLFSGCPVLEELYVMRTSYEDRSEVFNISSLSLKRLSLTFYNKPMDYKVVINAPKLEYIFIYDNLTNHYSLTKPMSLVEANIQHRSVVISQLLPFLTSAKILKLTPRSRDMDHVPRLNMPIFPNLVRLVIGRGFDFLPVWLNNMPNLEHITFFYWCRPVIIDWNLPEEPPVCLRFKMKEIVVEDEISVTQEEFTFIRYLLIHSSILEKFIFYACHKNPERREQLLSFHRGSEHCQIEFVV